MTRAVAILGIERFADAEADAAAVQTMRLGGNLAQASDFSAHRIEPHTRENDRKLAGGQASQMIRFAAVQLHRLCNV